MVRKDSAGGFIPVIERGALEVKFEVSWGATWSCMRIPVFEFIRMDDIFKPIIFGD